MLRTASFPPRIRLPSEVSGQYVRHWYDALGLQSEAYHMTKKQKRQLWPEFDCSWSSEQMDFTRR
jgi:hypothetical protein